MSGIADNAGSIVSHEEGDIEKEAGNA